MGRPASSRTLSTRSSAAVVVCDRNSGTETWNCLQVDAKRAAQEK